MTQYSDDRVENHVQFFTDVLGKEAEYEVTVLLKELVPRRSRR
jgi:hypothetical protein